MGNNWIVKEILYWQNGFIIFIIKMKKGNQLNNFIWRDHHENFTSIKDDQNQLTQEALKLRFALPLLAGKAKGIPELEISSLSSQNLISAWTHSSQEDGRLEKRSSKTARPRSKLIGFILYLFSILVYIDCLCLLPPYLMFGFLISTLFMLFYELRIFIKGKDLDAEGRMRRWEQKPRGLEL